MKIISHKRKYTGLPVYHWYFSFSTLESYKELGYTFFINVSTFIIVTYIIKIVILSRKSVLYPVNIDVLSYLQL